MSDTIVLTFGRFNPPTKGHEVVFNEITKQAAKHRADAAIFTSQTTQNIKNPLSYRDKIKFLRKANPKIRVYEKRTIKTLFDAVGWAFEEGYTKVVVVLGSDRIPTFRNSIVPWVKREFPDGKIVFAQAGANRSNSSKGVAGISGTKVRQSVAKGDFKKFASMISDNMSQNHKKQLFDILSQRLGKLSEAYDPNRPGRKKSDYPKINKMKLSAALDRLVKITHNRGDSFWFNPSKNLAIEVPLEAHKGGVIHHSQFVGAYPKEFGFVNNDDSVKNSLIKLMKGHSVWEDEIAIKLFKDGWIRVIAYGSRNQNHELILQGMPESLKRLGQMMGRHAYGDVLGQIDINKTNNLDGASFRLKGPTPIRRFLKSGVIKEQTELNEGVFARVSSFSRPVDVYINPSTADLRKMEAEHKRKRGRTSQPFRVRGFFNDKDLYAWDGWESTHITMLQSLKMSKTSMTGFFAGKFEQAELMSLSSLTKGPGFAWVEKDEKLHRDFRGHVKRLHWKSRKTSVSEQTDAIVLPQHSHIVIHQLDNSTFDAKIDTGNNSFCALHADNIRLDKSKTNVFYDINGKTYSSKVVAFSKVSSSMGNKQTRVVIDLDVHFANSHYENVKFSLTDRSGKDYPVLLGTQFLSQTNVLVKPIKEALDKEIKPEYSVTGRKVNIYKNPTPRELSQIRKEAKNSMPIHFAALGVAPTVRFFANENDVYAWEGFTLLHDDILKRYKFPASKFDTYGQIEVDGTGTIKEIGTLTVIPNIGGVTTDRERKKIVFGRLAQIQKKLGWRLSSDAQRFVERQKVKLDEYKSFGSAVRDVLEEGRIANIDRVAFFDSIDRMSSNHWYADSPRKLLEARCIYLPESGMAYFWDSSMMLHAEAITKLAQEFEDVFDNEYIVYAGIVTRDKNDKKAFRITLDHSYKPQYAHKGRWGIASMPKLDQSKIRTIMKAFFVNLPKGLVSYREFGNEYHIFTPSFLDKYLTFLRTSEKVKPL